MAYRVTCIFYKGCQVSHLDVILAEHENVGNLMQPSYSQPIKLLNKFDT